jgi:PAS domain-containing protein
MSSDITPEVASRLLEFVDRMDDLIGVCDEHGRVLYMNQTARKHLGIGNATDLTTADLFAPEAFASYYDEVRPALLHGGTWTGELAIHAQGGGSVPMLFSVVAGVGPGGEITGLVTHGRPVPGDPPHRGTSDASDIVEREVLLDRVAHALNRRAESCAAIVYVEVRDMTTLSERHGGLIARF